MALSMQHWNSCQVCVVDCETTGLDPNQHEIWQLCILPLDSNLDIRRDVPPLYLLMKPELPSLIDWDLPVMQHNKKKICQAIIGGITQEAAIGLFEHWYKKLDLPLNKSGYNNCKVMPLGQNYTFDKGFLQRWLGIETYYDFFDYHDRDTMVVANFLNDRAGMKANKVPFSKVNLRWLAKTMGVPLEERDAHDALQDCMTTAAVYKAFLGLQLGLHTLL